DAGDQLGRSIAFGDFNHDGKADLLMGAPFGDGKNNTRPDSGDAYVVYGKASPAAVYDLATTNNANVRLFGAATDDSFGRTGAVVDFDGDGIDDIVVAAISSDASGKTDSGRVYVVRGTPTLSGDKDMLPPTSDFLVAFDGKNVGDEVGISLAGG